ncbi:MAG: 3-oxocholest-4-en-26-oyl-CoA dehydrogenase beta subunit [Actinomycetota bacterium]|jgi:alkylation response protein AidB-like acyl-CoA dehydrogenase
MNFDLSEEQQAVRDAAAQVLGGERATWAELAKADLLGIALPEATGGSGHTFFELALILEEQGRAGVHLPIVPTVVTALAIAAFGTEEQQQKWLPGVISGDVVLTAVLDDALDYAPYAAQADAILVGDRLVPSSSLEVTDLQTTSGEPQGIVRVTGDGERLDVPTSWLHERWMAALCALQAGISAKALALTAEYTTGREQFGKPVATFQAVAQRAADAYIDTQAIQLSAYQAAWRLAEGLPAANEVAVAKFWAADGGTRVALAAQHLHGGIGVDTDYPLHTYTTWTKQIELTLGSATPSLVRLGKAIADEPI